MMKNFLPFEKRLLIHIIFSALFGMSFALTAIVQAGSASLGTAVATPKPNKPTGTADSLTVGGFNTTRASLSSISTGSAFEEARASLAVHYPQVTYRSFTTLTQQAVSNVDILILSATYDFSVPIAPLTAAEQTVLFDFVADGGCAILLPENQDFVPANESLIDPFGMDITGMIWGWLTVPVTSPSTTPLTSGFHGIVSSFTQGWPGGLTNLGPFATSYAANSLGDAIAVIEPDTITADSGAVLIFSDATSFIDSGNGGGFADNEVLFLNSIAFCQQQIVYVPFIVRD